MKEEDRRVRGGSVRTKRGQGRGPKKATTGFEPGQPPEVTKASAGELSLPEPVSAQRESFQAPFFFLSENERVKEGELVFLTGSGHIMVLSPSPKWLGLQPLTTAPLLWLQPMWSSSPKLTGPF